MGLRTTSQQNHATSQLDSIEIHSIIIADFIWPLPSFLACRSDFEQLMPYLEVLGAGLAAFARASTRPQRPQDVLKSFLVVDDVLDFVPTIKRVLLPLDLTPLGLM